MWEELGAIRGIWDDPWCLGDDFNVILSQRERNSQGRLTGAMRRFAQIVDELELHDLLCKGVCLPGVGVGIIRLGLDWIGVEVRGMVSFKLATKMKELKQKIKVWNREVFGRLEVNKNSALQQVEYWDGVESERSLSEGETELKKEAKESFKKNNSLDRIKINGVWMTEEHEMREGIVNAFQHLLSEELGWRVDIEGMHLNRLNSVK
ncbi:hypothetical protein CK203_000909 [Vitis vinifera]|uniref:Uncharacterized protein n=1 Tax=Vitis vinifera TaxID=29760 RepID=A0A438KPM1_VITVI|nr:hypothetical protein CK203_000909 [Vitis vinifera]